jgi:hypothetical protein
MSNRARLGGYMEHRFITSKLEVRSEEERSILTGYAAVFNSPSLDLGGFTEYIRKGAFTKTLKNAHQKALFNHNSDFVLGSTKSGTLKLWEDEKGLKFELELPNTQTGRDLAESVRRGDIDGNSFGFNISKEEWDETDPKEVKRFLDEVNLFEISPTPFPAYPETELGFRTAYDKYKRSIPNYEIRKRILQLMQMEV